MSDKSNLRTTAYSGAIATAIQQGGRIFVQFASLIILARILSPEDFGVYAMVMPIATIVSMFQGMGLNDAIIQRRDVSHDQLNTLYWINIAFTGAIALALVLGAPLVALFYGEPRTAALTAAWAVPVLIGAFAQQQYAILARDLKFFTLMVIDLACVLAGFATAIICALIFKSYWALWASGVASCLLWTIASTAVSSWRPSAPWKRADTQGLLGFGAKLTGVSLIEFVCDNVDKLLIGRFVGVAALGFYDRAYKLLLFPLQNVSWPLGRVAIPLLSRLRDEPERMRTAYLGFIGQINFITVPGVVAALITSDVLIRILLGDEWTPSAEIFAWLGVAALLQPMTGSVYWLLTVQGRTRDMFTCAVINGVMVVAAVVIGLQDGAVGVARALAIAELVVRAPVLVEIVCRGGPVRRLDFVKAFAPFALAATTTWSVAQWLTAAGVEGIVFIGLVGVSSYTVAAIAMLAFQTGRTTLRETLAIAERGLRLLPLPARG